MFKKINFLLVLLLMTLPNIVLAYSDYIIAGGDNIGIQLKMDGVMIIGTYDIDGENPAVEAGLQEGDKIISINQNKISSIREMTSLLSHNRDVSIVIGYVRNGEEQKTTLTMKNQKTGLYLKDTISGIGTLTFIDPTTKRFGALGHEIVDSSSGKIASIKEGSIFTSSIRSIQKSKDGIPGEKNATLNVTDTLGIISKNTNKGIFGTYEENFDNTKTYKVAHIEDIKEGDAVIRTVLKGQEIKEYSIRILKVSNTKDKTKNIIFEITDQQLLEETGGIIQGMSGSPIIQGDYIVGAVTHVVVNGPEKGYGILITNMLEEAEREE